MPLPRFVNCIAGGFIRIRDFRDVLTGTALIGSYPVVVFADLAGGDRNGKQFLPEHETVPCLEGPEVWKARNCYRRLVLLSDLRHIPHAGILPGISFKSVGNKYA